MIKLRPSDPRHAILAERSGLGDAGEATRADPHDSSRKMDLRMLVPKSAAGRQATPVDDAEAVASAQLAQACLRFGHWYSLAQSLSLGQVDFAQRPAAYCGRPIAYCGLSESQSRACANRPAASLLAQID